MYLVAILLFLGCVLGSCTYSTAPVSLGGYPANVSAVIQTNCLGGDCHSTATSTNTKLDLSSWNAMTKGSEYFNEIIPFNAVKSHFFGHINTNQNLAPVITPLMPLARDPLSTEDQLTFFNWIIQGAKNEGGKIPYSEATKKIFVVNQNEDMVSVIDAETQRLIRIISVGTGSVPKSVAILPDQKSFIVAMAGANGITRKYDVESYQALGEFESNFNPYEIAITPDGSKGYMTDDSYQGNTFAVFDPVSMKLLKSLSSPLIIQPHGVTISPDGKYAYICGRGSDNILRIDTHTDSVLGCLLLGPNVQMPVTSTYNRQYDPEKIVISADSKKMYVTCVHTSEIVVFDLLRDSIEARIPIPYFPAGAAITPDGTELWATATGTNKVYILSILTNTITSEIDSVSLDPQEISFTPDGAFAYVACEFASGGVHHHGTGEAAPSSCVVIDAKTRKVISILELPAYSVSIATGYK